MTISAKGLTVHLSCCVLLQNEQLVSVTLWGFVGLLLFVPPSFCFMENARHLSKPGSAQTHYPLLTAPVCFFPFLQSPIIQHRIQPRLWLRF